MKSFGMRSALVASTLLLAGNLPAVTAQSESKIGCFSSSKPLEDQGAYTYQSNGYCLDLCYNDGFSVFALSQGDHCLCGNTLPAESSKLDNDDECDTPCAAWPIVMCGGSSAYSVYLTGLKNSVPYYSSSSTTTKSSDSNTNSSTSTGTSHSTSTSQPATYATAQSETQSASKNDKGGPNTAAIAAGVVVGVVGLCALIGAIFFLWRFKTRHPADQRLREVNNVERFGKPMSQSSMSDSRFDPDFMAQRRQSNGSIDDDQDFSRRILQVTNPDRS